MEFAQLLLKCAFKSLKLTLPDGKDSEKMLAGKVEFNQQTEPIGIQDLHQ